MTKAEEDRSLSETTPTPWNTHTTAILLMALTFTASAQCGPEVAAQHDPPPGQTEAQVVEPEPVHAVAPPPPFVIMLGHVPLGCVEESPGVALCHAHMLGTLRCHVLPDSAPACFAAGDTSEADARRERMVRELTGD